MTQPPVLPNDPDTRMKYVCGFLFDKDNKSIVLIRKNHPPWQNGYMNGVGGWIKAEEEPVDAMQREFNEEAGMRLGGWKCFCTLNTMDAIIYWFVDHVEYIVNHGHEEMMSVIRLNAPEPVYWCQVDHLNELDLIPNTRWLITMAMLGSNGLLGNVWPYTIWEPSKGPK
ncbi:MAG: NUDIX hydrolase [Candidatus Brocadiales bacterium]|nr:NUDIX hydrolase [Candidatus Bathyanammoxibius sp.]